MFELFFNTHYASPWAHLDNDEALVRPIDPVGYLYGLFFTFDGRIGRMEYVAGTVAMLASMVALYLCTALLVPRWLDIVVTASFVPAVWAGLALEVKRFHDQGRSGWWVLLGVLPMIGNPVKLAMLALVPSDGPNGWGA
ncbi:MAG: DUF805 domain-containing protein [Alphaproteobacteria bacterium]|nr:DUF805 domain-containing protein [Alphaproteobacteria bacterium]